MVKKSLAVAVVLGGVALIGSVAIGGSNGRLPAKTEGFVPLQAHPVDAPAAAARAAVPRRVHKAKVKYFETATFPVPGGNADPADNRADFSTRCPRRHKVVSGYYGTSGRIFVDYFAVGQTDPRRWEFGLANETADDGEAFIGVVCVKP